MTSKIKDESEVVVGVEDETSVGAVMGDDAGVLLDTDTEAETRFARAAARRESERPAATRQRRPNFGGPRLKLAVIGEIPGYHLYWENDDKGAIEQLLYEGFEFVEPTEVQMASHIVSDTDTANRVSRYVGAKEDGTPMRAYLLKCSDELWAERENDRLIQADIWDNDMRQRASAPGDGHYTPKGLSSSIDTQFRKEH